MTAGTVALANIPKDSQNFITTMQADAANNLEASAAKVQNTFQASIGTKGETGALGAYISSIKKDAGVTSPVAIQQIVKDAMQNVGATSAQIGKAMATVTIDTKVNPPKMPEIPKPPPVDYTTKVPPPTLPPPPKGGTVTFPAKVAPVIVPPAPRGGLVNYPSLVTKPIAPPAPAGGTVVYHSIVVGPGGAGFSTAGGLHFAQQGFKVPGTGSAISSPRCSSPAKLVVPKSTWWRPWRSTTCAGKVPGFAPGVRRGPGTAPAYPVPRVHDDQLSTGAAGASWSAQQWGQMTSTFLQAAQLSHAMGSGERLPGRRDSPRELPGLHQGRRSTLRTRNWMRCTRRTTTKATRRPAPSGRTSWTRCTRPKTGCKGYLLLGFSLLPGTLSAAKKAAETGQQILAAFQKTLTGEGAPWAAFGKSILQGLEDGIKGAPSKSLARHPGR